MSENETSSRSQGGQGFWPIVAVIVAIVAAGVVLAVTGWNTSEIAGLLTGLAGIATGIIAVLRSNAQQNTKLDGISKAVNGDLDRRMREAMRDVLHGTDNGQTGAAPPRPRRRL